MSEEGHPKNPSPQTKGNLKQGPALVANEDGKNPPKLSDVGISSDVSSRAEKNCGRSSA